MKEPKKRFPFYVLASSGYGYNQRWYRVDHVYATSPEEAFKKSSKRLKQKARQWYPEGSVKISVCVEEDVSLRDGRLPQHWYFSFECYV